jgi:predicted RNase H-like HicB family nuclease
MRYTTAMNLKAIIHEAEEGGYWAEVPALPGCVTQGETREELEANLREAIIAWLAAGEGEFEAAAGRQLLELAV